MSFTFGRSHAFFSMVHILIDDPKLAIWLGKTARNWLIFSAHGLSYGFCMQIPRVFGPVRCIIEGSIGDLFRNALFCSVVLEIRFMAIERRRKNQTFFFKK